MGPYKVSLDRKVKTEPVIHNAVATLGASEVASSDLRLKLTLRAKGADPMVVIVGHNAISFGVLCCSYKALQLPR